MAQKTVSLLQPIGTPGQRVNLNPLNVVTAPNGGFCAGKAGLAIGAFAWQNPADPSGRSLLNSGTGSPLGFLHKTRTGVITTWLARSVDGLLPGQEATLYNGGDFYAVVGGTAPVTAQSRVYVDPTNGAVCASTTTNAVPTNFTFTASAQVGALVSISGYGTVAVQPNNAAFPPQPNGAPQNTASQPAMTEAASSTTAQNDASDTKASSSTSKKS
ncbi:MULTISPECIES: hypothetical protein [unclassified Saccharibacter]|uniref:structural cement protein Gp24 n=1 Tax=unclassified Saccharibacter TaxID=2648722 RepID=UPI00132698EF|nr:MULTISPECIES: hypothetical protein [unclassified Saccharibacter]MXV35683.1 hypothetical protein [Saccharibacter sp. EH611]MXV58297.1 hypothetical protein [Saccharibacter sp. EH70]MXV66406.1 hypothetical protein [Saccharibacter sp. EH60]